MTQRMVVNIIQYIKAFNDVGASTRRYVMRVGIYARVSRDEEDKDNDRYQEPENQLLPLREWASSQGYQVVGEYVDRASGADPRRPEFRRLMADAMQRKFQCILVWKFDRFTRESMSVAVAYVQNLKARGVAIKSLTESWLDTSDQNPVSDVILAVMAWAAAEERRKISERTRAGIKRLRAIGQWKGGRPKKSS